MTTTPKVTVLMPVYNCEAYVGEAIDSILGQSFTDFEFLIIDDASTDKTVPIVEGYSDSRIKFIRKPENTGYTNSLNYGLTIAQGEYIARMDGDDISLPERFAKQVVFMDLHTDVVALGTTYSFINTKRVRNVPLRHDDIKHALLKGPCLGHPTVMLRKSVFDEFKIIYNSKREPAEDYDLWVRLLEYGKLANLPDVLLDYRIHETQVSNARQQQQLRSAFQTKMDMLNTYIDHKCTHEELKALESLLSLKAIHTGKEMHFYKSAKTKLIDANNNDFFENIKLQKYFGELEKQIFDTYFLKSKKYNFGLFLRYLKISNRFDYKLPFSTSFKLFVKSIVLFKN